MQSNLGDKQVREFKRYVGERDEQSSRGTTIGEIEG